MAKSLFNQFAQIRGSRTYDDQLTMSWGEDTGRPKTSGLTVSVTNNDTITITAGGAFEKRDLSNFVVIGSSAYEITGYTDTDEVTVGGTPDNGTGISADLHYFKNAEDDLNYLRSQIIGITGEADWKDPTAVTLSGVRYELDNLTSNHNDLLNINGSADYYHLDGNTFSGISSDGSTLTISQNLSAPDADFTGNLTVTGTMDVDGAVDMDSTLNVAGATVFQTTVNVQGAGDFDTTLNVDGDADFGSNVGVSGTFGFDAGTTVTEIQTALTAPGDDDTLLTEAAVYNWVNTVSGVITSSIDANDTFIEHSDTPASYTADNMLYMTASGVSKTSAMTYDPATGDIQLGADGGARVEVDASANTTIYGDDDTYMTISGTGGPSFIDEGVTRFSISSDGVTLQYGETVNEILGSTDSLSAASTDVQLATAKLLYNEITALSGTVGGLNHNDDLAGLQGGNGSDQYYHLNSSSYTTLSGITDGDVTSWDTAYSHSQSAHDYDPSGTASTLVGNHESTYNHGNYNIAYSHSQTVEGNPHALDFVDLNDTPATLSGYGDQLIRVNAAGDEVVFESGLTHDGSTFTVGGDQVVNGTFGFDAGATVDFIDTTISGAGLDTSLVTEKAVIDFVTNSDNKIWEIVDTPTDQIRPIAAHITKALYHGGDLTIAGDLTVSGTTTTINTDELTVEDKTITVNSLEAGAGVTGDPYAGLIVDRGSETDYWLVFEETSDTFRVGISGSLQAVATREDSPVDTVVPWWNDSEKRFDTAGNTYMTIDTTSGIASIVADSTEMLHLEAGNTDIDAVKLGTTDGANYLAMNPLNNNVYVYAGSQEVLDLTANGQRLGLAADTYIYVNPSSDAIEFNPANTQEMRISTGGMKLKNSTIYVNDIQNVTDGNSISAASLDTELATAKLIYDYVNTVSGSVDHNELEGLQGGAADEYYHLTSDDYTALTTSGTEDNMLYIGSDGRIANTANMTYDADGIVNVLSLTDASQRFGAAADGHIIAQAGGDAVQIYSDTTLVGSYTDTQQRIGRNDAGGDYIQVQQSSDEIDFYTAGNLEAQFTADGLSVIGNVDVQSNLTVSGSFNFDVGATVEDIVTSITADDDTHLVTEGAVIDYVDSVSGTITNNYTIYVDGVSGTLQTAIDDLGEAQNEFIELTDTFSTYTADNMLYTTSSGVEDTADMTYDSATGDIRMGADGGAKMMVDADVSTTIYGDDDTYITVSGGSTGFVDDGTLRMSITDEGLAMQSGARVNDIAIAIVEPGDDTTLATEKAIVDYITTVTGSLTTIHNELVGLQGGTTDEYYHLTAYEEAAFSSDNTTFTFTQILAGTDLTLSGDVDAVNADFSGNVGVSGTFGFDVGTTVNDIQTSMGGTGDDNTLLTEKAIFDYVNTISGAIDHNELETLQGGAANEYYHLNNNAYTQIIVLDGATFGFTGNLDVAGNAIVDGSLDVATNVNVSGTLGFDAGTSVNEIQDSLTGAIDVSSTDDQLVTAKLIYDSVGSAITSSGTPTYMYYVDADGHAAETGNMTYDPASGDIQLGNSADTGLFLDQDGAASIELNNVKYLSLYAAQSYIGAFGSTYMLIDDAAVDTIKFFTAGSEELEISSNGLDINDNLIVQLDADVIGNVTVSGSFNFDVGATVDDIVTSITADDDTHLVTEGAVKNYVDTISGSINDGLIWEIVDTPTNQIRPRIAYLDYGIYTEGNVTIGGDLTVTGTTFYSNTEIVNVADNIMHINYGETGNGVQAGEAGLQVDRGSETDYYFVFDEGTDTFRVGVSGTQDSFNSAELQPVATREDNPTDMRVPWWEDSSNTFRTDGDTYITVASGSNTITANANDVEVLDMTDTVQRFGVAAADYVSLTSGNVEIRAGNTAVLQMSNTQQTLGVSTDTNIIMNSAADSIAFNANNTGELTVNTSGVSLKTGASVNEILNVADADSISAGSTDAQLVTAALLYETIISGTVTSAHNDLSGLQGGSVSERYHLTSALASTVGHSHPYEVAGAVSTHESNYNHDNYDTAYSWGDWSATTSGLQTQITSNDGDISTNITNIATNASGIAVNVADIADLVEVQTDSEEPTGFVNYKIGSEISVVSGTVTISGTSEYSYYIKGTKYTKAAGSSDTVAIDTDSEGLQFVYFDGETLSTLTAWTNDLLSDYAYVANAYWDDTNAEVILFGDERHGMIMDAATHMNLHNSLGTVYVSGFSPTGVLTDENGSVNTHAQFGVGSGFMLDEDLMHLLGTASNPATLPVFYKDGASALWRRDTNSGYAFLGGTLPKYNLLTGSTWSQPEITDGYMVLVHLFATNDADQPFIAVMGENQYASNTAAREGASNEMNDLVLSGMPTAEFVAVASFILQGNSAYSNTPNARFRTTDTGEDFVDWRNANITGGGGVSANEHSNLAGLDDPNQHPASSIYTTVSGFNGALSTADTDVQKALDTLDNVLAGSSHDHYDMDATWSGSSVWTMTDGTIDGSVPDNFDVFVNGLKNRAHADYYTASAIGTVLTVEFAYDTYDTDWVNVTYTVGI